MQAFLSGTTDSILSRIELLINLGLVEATFDDPKMLTYLADNFPSDTEGFVTDYFKKYLTFVEQHESKDGKHPAPKIKLYSQPMVIL